MKYCFKCYDQLPSEDATFCIECGARQPAEGPTKRLEEQTELPESSISVWSYSTRNMSAQCFRIPPLGELRVGRWERGESDLYWADGVVLERDEESGELYPKKVRIGVRAPFTVESFEYLEGGRTDAND